MKSDLTRAAFAVVHRRMGRLPRALVKLIEEADAEVQREFLVVVRELESAASDAEHRLGRGLPWR